MTTPLSMVITVTASEGNADALREKLVRHAEGSREEDGCVVFDLFEAAPGTFHIVEIWRDESFLVSHMEQPYTKETMAAFGTMLSAEPTVSQCKPVSVGVAL